MYKVKLTRIKSDHSNLRTDTVDGECEELPKTGKSFVMTGPPLNPDAVMRVVETSEVLLVDWTEYEDKIIDFNTMNSMYRLEIL